MKEINKKYIDLIDKYVDYLEENIEKAKDKRAKCGIGTPKMMFWQKRLESLVKIKGEIEDNIEFINRELESIIEALTTSVNIE